MNIQVKDKISFEILEDGVVTVSCEGISGENHLEAEQLIAATFEELGGERKLLYRKPHSHHGHGHTHTHSHATVRA
jgi:hypothetical protein